MQKNIRLLESLLLQRRISRRTFMQQAAAAGVSMSMASTLATRAFAAEPNKGGVLRAALAHGSTTDSLDPATYENDFMIGLSFAVNNYLTEVSAAGAIQGELAQSWEASADARTWTFQLRPGATFHNGKDVTADDVVASINHHRGEDSKSAAKVIVDPIVDIKADGKSTVVVTLESGNADFPFIVSDYHLPIHPSKDGNTDWRSGVGAGPYALESYEPGVRASFKRHDGYWKSDRAHFDGIEFLAIVDTAARMNALMAGDVDLASRVDLKTVGLLQRRPNIKIEQTSGTLHYTFAMHTDVDPFSNNEVRLALKHAIDREALVQKILKGYGVVGNDHPIGRSNRYYASDLEQRTYDPDKAKFHLKNAGLDKLTVQLSAAEAAFTGAVDAATLYREAALPAGIDIEVVREPNDGYWSNVWLVKPWTAVYWGGRPTEDWMFSTAYAKGAAWNDTHWDHEQFNKLLIDARAELDETKRREMYVEMQRLCRDEGGVVVPMFANYVWATSDKIGHAEQMGANWDLDGQKFTERWWFAG